LYLSATNNIFHCRSQKERQIKETWNDWERRALTTSGYIIGSTLLLQGPLILLHIVGSQAKQRCCRLLLNSQIQVQVHRKQDRKSTDLEVITLIQ
jgi:hypothetical protein